MKAIVNRIIKHTFIDGPGCRLAVFLQGCNMRCLYCHNPETQRLCCNCGKCAEICPSGALTYVEGKVIYDLAKCRECDLCVKECPYFSSPKCKEMSVDELYSEILQYSDFLDGVTVSGGECSLQHEFIYELFRKLKDNTELSCFADTNGYMDVSALDRLCKVTDGFMFDLKAFDGETHKRLTGLDNTTVMKNMEQVSAKGLLYEVRTVVVKGFTDNEAEIRGICEYIKGLNDYTVFKLIPFRPHGVRTVLADTGSVEPEKFEALFQLAKAILGDRARKISVLE